MVQNIYIVIIIKEILIYIGIDISKLFGQGDLNGRDNNVIFNASSNIY